MALDNLVQSVREQVQARFYQAGQAGAWQELDRNLQAVLGEVFAKLDLVTREEFDRQSALLSDARVKLQALEKQLRDLEAQAKRYNRRPPRPLSGRGSPFHHMECVLHMSLALVRTRAAIGLAAPQITVEVHQSNGLPALTIVGLPEAAVRESKDRVRSALLNAGFEFPQRRLTINLAPADLPKITDCP